MFYCFPDAKGISFICTSRKCQCLFNIHKRRFVGGGRDLKNGGCWRRFLPLLVNFFTCHTTLPILQRQRSFTSKRIVTTGDENAMLPSLGISVNYRSAHAMVVTCTHEIGFHVKCLRPLVKSNMKYAIRMWSIAYGQYQIHIYMP